MAGIFFLAWLVNGLLLWAVGCFLGDGLRFLRTWIAALFGAAAVVFRLLPDVSVACAYLYCSLLQIAMCALAFGFQRKLIWEVALFILLHFSVGGLSMQKVEPLRMLLGALGISLACWLGREKKQLIPVELNYGGKDLHLTALYDTGNTLLDPLTGQGVLILDAPSARQLTGLTLQQLNNPVESLDALSGLRLIPYHTVGNSGFLLALRVPGVRVGSQQKSLVVAFAPQEFGKHYQALTGGSV